MSPSDPGDIITTETGERFFIYGKNRIKITEHFSTNGKQINEIVEELIQYKIKEKVTKIA